MPRPPHDFDASYASETPPAWDIGRPQPAFDRLAQAGGLVGRVLDAGAAPESTPSWPLHSVTKWWESTSQ